MIEAPSHLRRHSEPVMLTLLAALVFCREREVTDALVELFIATVFIALVAAGFDEREVPAQRSAAQRRSRRLEKTDAVDAVACARALAAEPTLGPVQVLEVHSPLLAKIEAVLERRRMLVELRTLMLHHVADQIAKLPTDIRDLLAADGKIEGRLRRLEGLDNDIVASTSLANTDSDDSSRSSNVTVMNGVRSVAWSANSTIFSTPTELRCVTSRASGRSPRRHFSSRLATRSGSRRSPSSRAWCGTGAVALSSGEGHGQPVRHRVDFRGNRRINSVLYIASVTQQRDNPDAKAFIDREITEGKTRREARRSYKRHLANRAIRRMWKDEKRRL